MHEYSIVQALMGSIESEARARGALAVHGVCLKIGELSGVEPELLRSAYEIVRPGTLCSDAELEIVESAARWICRGCGRALERGAVLRCPECREPGRLESGDEILLESLELEVA